LVLCLLSDIVKKDNILVAGSFSVCRQRST